MYQIYKGAGKRYKKTWRFLPPQACCTYSGSPWENGYNERFNGTLRNEVLNAEWFSTIHQAQTVINIWLRQYNHIRPHSSLNWPTPNEFATRSNMDHNQNRTNL